MQFVHQDIPEQVPKDISLCPFRVVQEALRNVVKHSGASEVKVELTRRSVVAIESIFAFRTLALGLTLRLLRQMWASA